MIIRVVFFLIFQFFFHFGFDIKAQTVDETIKSGDELFEIGDYNNSLTYYLRARFFSDENLSVIQEKIGDNYFQLNDYLSAEYYYDSAFINCSGSMKKEELHFKKVDCRIFVKQYESGIHLMKNSGVSNIELSLEYDFYMGILYFGIHDYEISKTYFLKAVCDTCSIEKQEIIQLFETNFNYPNPETAYILSSILPGLGQLYSGEFKHALNSFILLGLITVVAYDMYSGLGIADPVISIYPWFNRYFKGGMENAEETALRKRKEIRNEVLNQLIRISERIAK